MTERASAGKGRLGKPRVHPETRPAPLKLAAEKGAAPKVATAAPPRLEAPAMPSLAPGAAGIPGAKAPAAPKTPARRGLFGKRPPAEPASPLEPPMAKPAAGAAAAQKTLADVTAAPEAPALPALKLVGDRNEEDSPALPAPDSPPPAKSPASQPAALPKMTLSSKLTAAESFDGGPDEPDTAEEPGTSAPGAEDDDPGPLTQTILESRARREEKPDRGQARAFPWLRR
jgi:hypothetical protein